MVVLPPLLNTLLLKPLIENWLSLVVTRLTSRGAVPVFVTVTYWLELLPNSRVPKSMLAGDMAITGKSVVLASRLITA